MPTDRVLAPEPPHRPERHLPSENTRPLGGLSDFNCEQLGEYNDGVHQKTLSPDDLFAIAESLVHAIPDHTFEILSAQSNVDQRRLALLDLAYLSRALDIAFTGDTRYKAMKAKSALFHRLQQLADVEGVYPVLTWAQIASQHPISDPRTFLSDGPLRDQEILLYQTQHDIEGIFREIIDMDYSQVSAEQLADVRQRLDTSVKMMGHLSKVRTIGQFYRLDPFLGPNNEYPVHATGSYSPWSYIAAYFLGENRYYLERLLDRNLTKSFDRDADPYIRLIQEEKFITLPEIIARADLSPTQRAEARQFLEDIAKEFKLFLLAHRGAVKRHAPDSFDVLAPANPVITNYESMTQAITDMPTRRSTDD